MKLKTILKYLALSVALVGAGFGLNFAVRPTEEGTIIEVSASIELSEKQVPATIETADGGVEIMELPTVEAVDSGNITSLIDCAEGEEECGLGKFIYAPTETPQAFKDYTYGGCWDTDGSYNEQCFDLGDLYWQNYAGRRLSTCGTGAAKGTWAGDCKFTNAKDDFTLVYEPTQLQAGDWVVFNNGTWGHIGMALGGYNNGYVALLGQNQGGALCPGSKMGGSTNIINISLKNFAGAFRPNSYIIPDPEPEPTPEPEKPVSGDTATYTVKKGDTLGAILRANGYKGKKLFGDNGLAQAVATKNGIKNRGLIYPGQTIKIDKSLFSSF